MYYNPRMEPTKTVHVLNRHLMWYEILLASTILIVISNLIGGPVAIVASALLLFLSLGLMIFSAAKYGNNRKYKPSIGGRWGAVVLSIAFWFIVICGASALTAKKPSTDQASGSTQSTVQTSENPATREELLARINEERGKVGVAPLVVDQKLEQSAQWKADKMLQTGNLAHVDPATGKNDGLEYLISLGAKCTSVSENLSWSTDDTIDTAQESVQWWMGSESHRTAMLDANYTSTGFGITEWTIVEHFCKP